MEEAGPPRARTKIVLQRSVRSRRADPPRFGAVPYRRGCRADSGRRAPSKHCPSRAHGLRRDGEEALWRRFGSRSWPFGSVVDVFVIGVIGKPGGTLGSFWNEDLELARKPDVRPFAERNREAVGNQKPVIFVRIDALHLEVRWRRDFNEFERGNAMEFQGLAFIGARNGPSIEGRTTTASADEDSQRVDVLVVPVPPQRAMRRGPPELLPPPVPPVLLSSFVDDVPDEFRHLSRVGCKGCVNLVRATRQQDSLGKLDVTAPMVRLAKTTANVFGDPVGAKGGHMPRVEIDPDLSCRTNKIKGDSVDGAPADVEIDVDAGLRVSARCERQNGRGDLRVRLAVAHPRVSAGGGLRIGSFDVRQAS